MTIAINCSSQVYLEKCKYVIKENKMIDFIDATLELDSDDNSDGSECE